VQDLVGEGDLVVARLLVHGRHNGSFPAGTTPTGRPWTQQQIHIFRVRDGLITEHWAAHDSLDLLRQAGALPFAEAATEGAPA
jgi:predicted ester cyclase